jgi:hypothetical protein
MSYAPSGRNRNRRRRRRRKRKRKEGRKMRRIYTPDEAVLQAISESLC